MAPQTHVINLHGFEPQLSTSKGRSEAELDYFQAPSENFVSVCQLPGGEAEFPVILNLNTLGTFGQNLVDKKSVRLPFWAVFQILQGSASIDKELSYPDYSGHSSNISLRSIILQCSQQLLRLPSIGHNNSLGIYPIPNRWDERVQDKLIRALPGALNNKRLIWSPVAILLAWIEKQTKYPSNDLVGKSVLVLDFGITGVEATLLKLRNDQDYIVPVRSSPSPKNHFYQSYLPFDIAFAQSLSTNLNIPHDDKLLYQLLVGSAAAYQLLSQRIKGSRRYIFGSPGNYTNVTISPAARDSAAKLALSEMKRPNCHFQFIDNFEIDDLFENGTVESAIEELLPWIKSHISKIDDVLISGELSGIELQHKTIGAHLRGLLSHRLHLVNGNMFYDSHSALSQGAALYGQREQLDLPTYFDVLPKYEVFAMQRELGKIPKFGAVELVEKAEVRGGRVWKPSNPVSGFSIREGAREFILWTKRENDPGYKAIPAEDFPTPTKDEAVLIFPEMRPAAGYAKVVIRPKDTPDLFGHKKELVLVWEKGQDGQPPSLPSEFGYPFVDWTEGRLASSTELNMALKLFCERNANQWASSPLSIEQIRFLEKIFVPFRINPNDYSETYRGAFGNKPFGILFDQELVTQVGSILFESLKVSPDALGPVSPQQKTIRLLGFMCNYAPKEFVDYLCESLRSGLVPTMNEIIAVGRTFNTPSVFNCFLEYFTNLLGLPETNLGWHWWAFFRSYNYYPETALADKRLVGDFFQRIIDFLSKYKNQNIPSSTGPSSLYNQMKFCLCAVLYGLRSRETHNDFLGPSDKLYLDLESLIGSMQTKVGFLQSMLNAMPPERRRQARSLGLNGLVLEFLTNKASQDSVDLLADFTKTLK